MNHYESYKIYLRGDRITTLFARSVSCVHLKHCKPMRVFNVLKHYKYVEIMWRKAFKSEETNGQRLQTYSPLMGPIAVDVVPRV